VAVLSPRPGAREAAAPGGATRQGNPRRINRLADLALLVGYADELSLITATQIECVSDDLVALTANA
jgi:hypothetical protein